MWYEEPELIGIQVADCQKGNPVRIGDGHAAVIGDETCQEPLSEVLGLSKGQRMGRGRKPEGLKAFRPK
jgi:hypothetical protein